MPRSKGLVSDFPPSGRSGNVACLIVVFLLGFILCPSPVLAYISHWDPREAFFIRQFAYLLWAMAMIFFIFALIQEKLQQHRGFRRLVWAAIFFALWNINCFVGQFIGLSLEHQAGATAQDLLRSETGLGLWLYSLSKLDHLLLAPAMLFFYLGVRAFCREPEVEPRC
ncbi:MAG: hypothetical protein FJ135_07665 [Deltaproteobacteria bacterium]|nr:hypothetical protein [Deltaproteobacteria bacterium]